MKENAKLLAESLHKFGFPEENIITLFDANATSQALEDSLKLFWRGGKYAYADRLFFYFGGHGDTLK